MSAEIRNISVGYTVKDSADLPEGMYADDVAEIIEDIVHSALEAWYSADGHEYLVCEPT